MNANLNTVNLSKSEKVRFDYSQSQIGNLDRSALPRLDHSNLCLQAKRMAVVNLEAALASWKSLENKRLAQMSHAYRCRYSASLRITPSRTGGIPRNLIDHWFNSNLGNS